MINMENIDKFTILEKYGLDTYFSENGYKDELESALDDYADQQTKALTDEIEELKKHTKQVDGEIEAVDEILNTFGQFCTLNGIKLTDSNKVGQAVIDFLKSDIYEIFKNRK